MTGSLLIVLAATALGPKPVPNSNWVRSSIPPAVLAKKVDTELHALTMKTLSYFFQFDLPHVHHGTIKCQCVFATPKQFRIQFPQVNPGGGKDEIELITLVSNGRKIGRRIEQGEVAVKALPSRRALPDNLVENWLGNGVLALFTAVGSSTDPLSALVKAASKPGSGYETHTETRSVVVHNRLYKYDRIVVTRTPEATKRMGSLFYEIAINEAFMLPTSMSSTVHRGKKVFYADMRGNDWAPVTSMLNPGLFDPHSRG